MGESWSGAGVVFGIIGFLACFSPSLLPRRWLLQGVASGATAGFGYLIGYYTERLLVWVLGLFGVRVDISRESTGTDWVLVVLAAVVIGVLWWRSVRHHTLTAELVGTPRQGAGYDLAATAVGLVVFAIPILVVAFVVWLSDSLAQRLAFLPHLVAAAVGLVVVLLAGWWANRMILRRVFNGINRSSYKREHRAFDLLTAPASPLRSGSPGAAQAWERLGRRGQIFTASGPDADEVARVTGAAGTEPIRVYAGLGSGTVADAVKVAMAEVRRTGALERSALVVVVPAGRGWVDEFNVQAVEYLTGGDCATVAVQYSHMQSALALLADPAGPRLAARLLFEAIEAEIAGRPQGSRPRLYVSGESLGAYGGQETFSGIEEMLARTSGALWIGTPGLTPLVRQLTERRQKGSPEIAPVVDRGRHVRFATRPAELCEDIYERPYGTWSRPRVVYLQHASDAIARFYPSVLWREPDWMRERAGSDVNPSLRWFPLASFFQICMDMLTSMDTPVGHGHIYEDEVVPCWAAILDRPADQVPAIIAAIRADVARLKRRPTPAMDG